MKYLLLIALVYLAYNYIGPKKINYNKEDHDDDFVEYEEIDKNV